MLPLLSNRAVGALELEVLNTLVAGLTVNDTLLVGALAATAADADAVNHVALLGLVTEATGLVRARGTRSAMDGRELTVLPASHAKQKAHHIRLLFLPKFLKVFVGT